MAANEIDQIKQSVIKLEKVINVLNKRLAQQSSEINTLRAKNNQLEQRVQHIINKI